VSGRLEDAAAIDDAQRSLHAQPQAFEYGGEVPGVDQPAVDGGLAAHRLGPGAVGCKQRIGLVDLIRCPELDVDPLRGARCSFFERPEVCRLKQLVAE
jgi:hypothetical protein